MPLTDNPFEPLETFDHERPPSVLYCHFEKVIFCNDGVSVIVSGKNVLPPSVDLNTWLEAIMSTDFAPALVAPVAPVAPFFALDQVKVLLNVLPSTEIGMFTVPESAYDVPVFA